MKSFYTLLTTLYYAAIVYLLPWQQANGTPSNGSLTLTIRTNQRVVQVGNTIRINCSLSDASNHSLQYGAGDIQWYHNDERLSGVRNHTLGASTSQILVEKSRLVDRGIYKCCLPLNCSKELNILIGSPPQQATNLQCSSTNFVYITCTWTRGGQHSNLTTTDVLLLSNTVKSNWKVVCPEETTTCEAKCSLSFDSSCTSTGHDYYQVQSTNELGSVNSSKILFATGSHTIPNAPTNVKVSNGSIEGIKSNFTLRIEWEHPVRNHYKTQVEYCIEYRWEGCNTTKTVILKSKKRYTLGNLTHPYGLYYVRVGSRAEHASSDRCHKYSKWQSARTTEKKPRDSPGNFTCKTSEPVTGKPNGLRNVTLSWTPPPSEYMQNGIIRGYDIKVRSLQQHHDLDNFTIGPNETTLHITDLSVNEKYTFTILARNSMGDSPLDRCDVPLSISPTNIWTIVAPILACVVVISMLPLAFYCDSCLTQFRKKLPDLNVPRGIMIFTLPNMSHRTSKREQEVFDELVTQPAGSSTAGQQLDSDDGHTGPISPESHHGRLLSTETCTTSIGSERLLSTETCTTSISSGRLLSTETCMTDVFNDEISYTRMTKTGLSPVDKDEGVEGLLSSTQEVDILMFSFEDDNSHVFAPKLCCPECDQMIGLSKSSCRQTDESEICDDSGVGGATAKPISGSLNVPISLDSVPVRFGKREQTDGGVLDWLPKSQEWASDFSPVVENNDSAATNAARNAAKGGSVDAIPSEYEKMSCVFKEQDRPLPTSAETNTENISSPIATKNSEKDLNYVAVAAASEDEDEIMSTISESSHFSVSFVDTDNPAKDISSGSEQPAQPQNGDNMQYIFVGLEDRL